MDKNVYVIIPAYNEGQVIKETISSLLPYGFSLVIIDDCSTDDTVAIVKSLPVYFIRHEINLGQGASIQTGIDFALQHGAEYFVTFDADGQHVASDIPVLLEYLQQKKLDIVFGSRFLGKDKHRVPFVRRYVLRAACFLDFVLTGTVRSDSQNGLRVFNHKTARCLNITENRMAHATEILLTTIKQGLNHAEQNVHINYTSYSRKKGQKNRHAFSVLFNILSYKLLGR